MRAFWEGKMHKLMDKCGKPRLGKREYEMDNFLYPWISYRCRAKRGQEPLLLCFVLSYFLVKLHCLLLDPQRYQFCCYVSSGRLKVLSAACFPSSPTFSPSASPGVTRWKRGHGSCTFNRCVGEGLPVGCHLKNPFFQATIKDVGNLFFFSPGLPIHQTCPRESTPINYPAMYSQCGANSHKQTKMTDWECR